MIYAVLAKLIFTRSTGLILTVKGEEPSSFSLAGLSLALGSVLMAGLRWNLTQIIVQRGGHSSHKKGQSAVSTIYFLAPLMAGHRSSPSSSYCFFTLILLQLEWILWLWSCWCSSSCAKIRRISRKQSLTTYWSTGVQGREWGEKNGVYIFLRLRWTGTVMVFSLAKEVSAHQDGDNRSVKIWVALTNLVFYIYMFVYVYVNWLFCAQSKVWRRIAWQS